MAEAGASTEIQLAEREPFVMHVIPSPGGGTVYQSNDNLIGDAEVLRTQTKKPDFVVIESDPGSGLIAVVYPTGTTLHGYQLDTLKKGIADTRDAAVLVKPAIDRLLSQIPETTPVVYPLGKGDERNLEVLRMMLITDSAYHLHLLVKRIIDADTQAILREAIVDGTEASIETLEKGAKKNAKDVAELENARKKLDMNKEELLEFEERSDLLRKLFARSAEMLTERAAAGAARKIETTINDELEKLVKKGDLGVESAHRMRKQLMDEQYTAIVKQVSKSVAIKERVQTEKEHKAITAIVNRSKIAPEVAEELNRVASHLKKKDFSKETLDGLRKIIGRVNRAGYAGDKKLDSDVFDAFEGAVKQFWKKREVTPNMAEVLKKVAEEVNKAVLKPEEFDSLQVRAKFLSNKERVLGKRMEEETDMISHVEEKERLRAAAMFTGNVQVTPEQRGIIKDLAWSYYLSDLKYATGRRKNVVIQGERFHTYAFKTKDGSFDIVVASDLDIRSNTLKKTANADAQHRLMNLVENSIGLNKFDERSETTFYVVGGNAFGSKRLDPKMDWSHNLMYSVKVATAWDVPKVVDLLNHGIKTEETKMVEGGFVDSGVTTITYNPKTKEITSETLKPSFLKSKRVEREIREEKKAREKILEAKNGRAELIPGTKKELEEARIREMLPSELLRNGKRDLSMLRQSGEVEERLKEMAPYADSEMPEAPRLQQVAIFGDVHIGNHTKYSLIRATVADAMSRDPNAVFLNGDILEGNLADFKYVARSIDLPGIPNKYRAWLGKQGMSEEQVKDEMLRFYEDNENTKPIYNINSQTQLFAELFTPIIRQVLSRGGYVVLTAGNHFNGTYRRFMLDEAIEMNNPIKTYFKGLQDGGGTAPGWEDRVFIIPGSEYGAGNAKIEGLDYHFSHKWEDSETKMEGRMETKLNPAAIIVTSHFHKQIQVETQRRLVIESLPMKDRILDTYLARIPTVAHTTEGYVFLEVGYYGDGSLAWHRTQPIIDRNLIARGLLEKSPFPRFVQEMGFMASEAPKQKVAVR